MPRVRIRILLVAALAAALSAALGGYFLAQQLDRAGPRLTSGTWLPQPKAVRDFALTDTSGRAFTLSSLKGTPWLVFFGFTHCPDVCPATLMQLARVRKSAAVAPPLRVLLVSVDSQRDTPELLGRYLGAFDPTFLGLTGDTRAIERMEADFGVAVSRVELPGSQYTLDHSAVVFLLDSAARIAAVFTPPFDVHALEADLRSAAPYLGASGGRSPT